ncbi:ribosome biogenesis GTPase Der [Neoactinobaculum massilliense]|uniref:ribosome biogenesis GTPase Der n=1 Tax=Neoactinobaculum massilliense TaxID=2364794 RepID=UPI000F53A4ED|nr:ribosome biogenesis GTPase Der [Neoactinobaculum massilliense]
MSETEPTEEERASVLRSDLERYELTEEDLADLAGETSEDEHAADGEGTLPILAIVGRPNVGKSSLVNRIVGQRVAVVQDTPGVTRDRVSYPAEWGGRRFTVVDTGGWEIDVDGLDEEVARQAEIAISGADAVLLVVDATVGATDTDLSIVKLLRRAGKPVILAANKVDSPTQEPDAAALWSLGMGEPHPVSAMHGRGTGDLLDAVVGTLPAVSRVAHAPEIKGPRRIAIVGRPNVGKSSLLNQLAGTTRAVVSNVAGTTRDPVDETVLIDGQPFTLVDTAGIRRRLHRTSGADYYASLRTAKALENAELGLALVDASQPLTEQDIRVIQQVIDAGRALVIVCNKWDEVGEERRLELGRELETELVQMQWAERINLSARTGWHTNRLSGAINTALASWDMRITTGKLNAFLSEVTAAHPHPVRGGKQPRILFGTQVSHRPPRFVLFTTGFLEETYRRFLENQLRERFGFRGTPIEISVRPRQRRPRK